MGAFRAFFNFLAKMGLIVRDDPPKLIDLAGREWGPEAEGLVLSAARGAGVISVVLRNVGPQSRQLRAPEFATWFRLAVDGAEPTPFGRELLRTGSAKPAGQRELAPGETLDAEIPIESIYRLHPGSRYDVTVSCTVSTNCVLVSNKIVFSTNH